MSQTSRSRYSVLGMLSLGIRTGYDIKKYTEDVLAHFWRESYGNLYPVLKRLESEGLATHTTEYTEGRPPKQVYSLTEEGQRELDLWLQQSADWEPPRHELLLKLLLSSQAPSSVATRHVLALRSQLLEARRLQEQAARRGPERPEEARRFRLTLRFGELVNEAMLTWCDEALSELREG